MYHFIFNADKLNFSIDKFGNAPLLEAIKNGHDHVAAMLVREGAYLNIDDAGSFLCAAVVKGDSDFIKRVLSNGIDLNSRDYDHRTALHVAASEGLYLMAKLLIEAGASVFTKDRYIQDIHVAYFYECYHDVIASSYALTLKYITI